MLGSPSRSGQGLSESHFCVCQIYDCYSNNVKALILRGEGRGLDLPGHPGRRGRASDGLLGAGRFRAAIQLAQDKFLQETVEVDLEKAQVAA